jgi:hypothetical protein
MSRRRELLKLSHSAHNPTMSIWGTTSGGYFSCPHCRARYAVTRVHAPERRKGAAICLVCDNTMSEWHDATQPSYVLIERPPAS